ALVDGFAAAAGFGDDFTGSAAEAVRTDPFALGSRLLCHTCGLPAAISSIVRPVSTEVMFSSTTSSSEANSSRCLISSHCGLAALDLSRDHFMRTNANEPWSRS